MAKKADDKVDILRVAEVLARWTHDSFQKNDDITEGKRTFFFDGQLDLCFTAAERWYDWLESHHPELLCRRVRRRLDRAWSLKEKAEVDAASHFYHFSNGVADLVDALRDATETITPRPKNERSQDSPPSRILVLRAMAQKQKDATEAATAGEKIPGGDEKPKVKKQTKDEANQIAREILRETPKEDLPKLTVRNMAGRIGCSTGLASGLPAWKALQEQLAKDGLKKSRGRRPKKMALTDKVETVLSSDVDGKSKLYLSHEKKPGYLSHSEE